MKIIFALWAWILLSSNISGKERTYIGSTPAHRITREFLGISLKDSIDFIRWKLVLRFDGYDLQCQYGISKANTNGFENEQQVRLSGKLMKKNNIYYLVNNGKTLPVIEINTNLVHFMDERENLLSGNGGYSYALNNIRPMVLDQFNFHDKQTALKDKMVYEGRTPCGKLSEAMGMNRASTCYKLKWYFVFYADPQTGKPTYYLKNGRQYKKETMAKGTWEIVKGKDGRTIYKVNPASDDTYTLYLVKAGDNILFFTDEAGNLLVGTEDFSFTLNRRQEEYARIER